MGLYTLYSSESQQMQYRWSPCRIEQKTHFPPSDTQAGGNGRNTSDDTDPKTITYTTTSFHIHFLAETQTT